MEVILKEDYLTLGYVGDRVKVRRGFARNYLLPRGIAVEASARNNRMLQHQLGAILAKRKRKKAEAEVFGKTINQVTVEFTLKMGELGKSFGSVTARDIETKLKELGYDIDRKQIKILEPIRSVGTHTVEVKLHAEVAVTVQVKVMAEKAVEAPAADAEGGETKKKRAPSRKKKAAEAEPEAEPEA